jgi:hypothetical protein
MYTYICPPHLLDPAQHEGLEYEVEPGHLFLVHPGPGSLRVPLNVLAEPFLDRKLLDFLEIHYRADMVVPSFDLVFLGLREIPIYCTQRVPSASIQLYESTDR